jgi:hypothetical protein
MKLAELEWKIENQLSNFINNHHYLIFQLHILYIGETV